MSDEYVPIEKLKGHIRKEKFKSFLHKVGSTASDVGHRVVEGAKRTGLDIAARYAKSKPQRDRVMKSISKRAMRRPVHRRKHQATKVVYMIRNKPIHPKRIQYKYITSNRKRHKKKRVSSGGDNYFSGKMPTWKGIM